MLATLSAKLDAITARLDRHDQEHAALGKQHESGAKRASNAENQIWAGVEALRNGHDEITQRLASIESVLTMAGSPVRSAERLTVVEGAISGMHLMMMAVGAAIALIVGSISGLIGSIIQAIGGPPRPPQ